MDFFTNLPIHTFAKGLQDYHVKVAKPLFAGILAKADYHIFKTDQDYTLIDGTTATDFGNELDITLVKKYNDNVKLVGGYSIFTAGDIFKENKGEGDANWFYLMTIVNF
jgi:hypothetical protein